MPPAGLVYDRYHFHMEGEATVTVGRLLAESAKNRPTEAGNRRVRGKTRVRRRRDNQYSEKMFSLRNRFAAILCVCVCDVCRKYIHTDARTRKHTRTLIYLYIYNDRRARARV